MRLIKLIAAVAVAGSATSAMAGEILSAAGFQDSDPSDRIVTSTRAGETVAVGDLPGVDARAQTDYGVNRIFNSAGGDLDGESFATSLWMESFTAQGTGTVRVSMTFTIDGRVAYGGSEDQGRDVNYYLMALRGTGWSIANDGYDDLYATRTTALTGGSRTERLGIDSDTDPTNGVENSFTDTRTNVTTQSTRVVNGDTVSVYSFNQQFGMQEEQRYTPTAREVWRGGTLASRTLYTQVPALGTSYQNMLANHALLGRTSLCSMETGGDGDYGCQNGDYPPTPVTLSFDITGGSSFTIVSALMSEAAENGTVDFFNTVRLTDLRVAGGTLTSDNGRFVANGQGGYGFAAATGAVPEPATWAMMIAGFGLAGAALRRRRSPAVA